MITAKVGAFLGQTICIQFRSWCKGISRNQHPFGVSEIARIAKAVPIGRTAVFGGLHGALPLANQALTSESQVIHSIQQLLGWL